MIPSTSSFKLELSDCQEKSKQYMERDVIHCLWQYMLAWTVSLSIYIYWWNGAGPLTFDPKRGKAWWETNTAAGDKQNKQKKQQDGWWLSHYFRKQTVYKLFRFIVKFELYLANDLLTLPVEFPLAEYFRESYASLCIYCRFTNRERKDDFFNVFFISERTV